MKSFRSLPFILLVFLAVACGAPVPDYHSRQHTDEAESHLAKALLANDKNAVAYWLEKIREPSLALCYLLEKQYGDSDKVTVTTGMLDLLFKRGASPNVICEHYLTDFNPLSLAVSLERPDIVQYLLARNADPNLYFTDKIEGKQLKPKSALMLAVSSHGSYHKEIDTYKEDAVYKERNSTLEKNEKACSEIVRLLVKAKADVNYQGSFQTPFLRPSEPEDKTALMIAAESLDREMISLLLEKGARKDLKDVHGKTADVYAANAGHLDLAQELMP
ncbi:MAG TPA: ankyrin repeat domain-containing protein [Thermoanaerobaculia bacterium]|nr:ankyrin repeat domain-containing protein [Thermoanaerobaculia bacterium]